MTDTKKTDKYGKRVLAIVLMIVTLLSSVAVLQKYFCIPCTLDQNRAVMFHKEPKNTIDVLLIGSSTTYTCFSSVYAYEKFGFTSFPYAVAGATCTSWKPAVQDALNSQNPKLIVVDVFGGGYTRDVMKKRNNQFYTIMSHTKLSKEKFEMARELSSEVDNTTTSSLLFPFLKYHGRIPRNLKNFKDAVSLFRLGPSPLKGAECITRTRKLKPVAKESFSDDPLSLDKETEFIIRNFMDYCKSKDLNVLFVKYPTVLTKKDPNEMSLNLRCNRILDIAHEYGFATLNMQEKFHEIGLVEREDYYNRGHANTRGQKKTTDYLGTFMQNELRIEPSALSKTDKKAWDESIPYYNAYCNLAEELIKMKKGVRLGDSPKLIGSINRILSGENIESVAEDY